MVWYVGTLSFCKGLGASDFGLWPFVTFGFRSMINREYVRFRVASAPSCTQVPSFQLGFVGCMALVLGFRLPDESPAKEGWFCRVCDAELQKSMSPKFEGTCLRSCQF